MTRSAGRAAASAGAALLILAASTVAGAAPQLSTGLTLGVSGRGDRDRLWSSTEFSGGLRGDLILGRDRDLAFGVGPYVELLTTAGFSDWQAGAGATLLVPVHAYLPFAISAGGYLGEDPDGGRQRGIAGELFWGSHGYNYHSTYVMTAGLFAAGRYALQGAPDVTVLLGARIDLELIGLPFLIAWGAIAGPR